MATGPFVSLSFLIKFTVMPAKTAEISPVID
jgi:hypothetical protein